MSFESDWVNVIDCELEMELGIVKNIFQFYPTHLNWHNQKNWTENRNWKWKLNFNDKNQVTNHIRELKLISWIKIDFNWVCIVFLSFFPSFLPSLLAYFSNWAIQILFHNYQRANTTGLMLPNKTITRTVSQHTTKNKIKNISLTTKKSHRSTHEFILLIQTILSLYIKKSIWLLLVSFLLLLLLIVLNL